MEIDCPPHAIAIWLEGDTINVRFPDRQLVTVEALPQLMSIMKHRRAAQERKERATVGTRAAPVQYDIDQIADAIKRSNGKTPEQVEAANEEKAARERRRLLRSDAKRQALKEANELLAIVGLN